MVLGFFYFLIGMFAMNFDQIEIVAETWKPQEILAWGFERFGDSIALASSLGAEDVILIDLAASVQKRFQVFTLDTGFLFPETNELIGRIEKKYGIEVERRQ